MLLQLLGGVLFKILDKYLNVSLWLPANKISEIEVDTFITDFTSPGNIWNGIILATREANNIDGNVLFSNRVYELAHNRTLNIDAKWKGVKGGTILRFVSGPPYNAGVGFDFSGRGTLKEIEGIIFDFNELVEMGIDINQNDTKCHFKDCIFENTLITQYAVSSGYAPRSPVRGSLRRGALIGVRHSPQSLVFDSCKLHRSLTDARPSRNPNDRNPYDGPADGGYAGNGNRTGRPHTMLVWVRTGSNPRYLRFENCKLWKNGFKDGRRPGGGWHDMDGFRFTMDSSTASGREIYFIGCDFRDHTKRMIKSNNAMGYVEVRDCLFYIEDGKEMSNAIFNLQLTNQEPFEIFHSGNINANGIYSYSSRAGRWVNENGWTILRESGKWILRDQDNTIKSNGTGPARAVWATSEWDGDVIFTAIEMRRRNDIWIHNNEYRFDNADDAKGGMSIHGTGSEDEIIFEHNVFNVLRGTGQWRGITSVGKYTRHNFSMQKFVCRFNTVNGGKSSLSHLVDIGGNHDTSIEDADLRGNREIVIHDNVINAAALDAIGFISHSREPDGVNPGHWTYFDCRAYNNKLPAGASENTLPINFNGGRVTPNSRYNGIPPT